MLYIKWTYALPEAARIIRTEVFVKEQGFLLNDEFDELDDEVLHIVLYDNKIPFATGRVIDSGNDDFHLGRIAIIENYRGQGWGKILVRRMEEAAVILGAKRILLGAQIQARPFYEKCGYYEYGEQYMDCHVSHVSMMKITNA